MFKQYSRKHWHNAIPLLAFSPLFLFSVSSRSHTQMPICTVIGGFHMSSYSTYEINDVILNLKRLGFQKAGPCHCSGEGTRRLMKKNFFDGYLEAGVGARFVFPSNSQEVR